MISGKNRSAGYPRLSKGGQRKHIAHGSTCLTCQVTVEPSNLLTLELSHLLTLEPSNARTLQPI